MTDQHPSLRDVHSTVAVQPPLLTRKLRLAAEPPTQVADAVKLLQGLDGLTVSSLAPKPQVQVTYHLTDYSLHSLEQALAQAGFRFDQSPVARLIRALTYFQEATQLRNLKTPERLIKKSSEIYTQAYDRQPHGDHDDTPPEWRQYR